MPVIQDIDLLPCPFCGAKAEVFTKDNPGMSAIRCSSCSIGRTVRWVQSARSAEKGKELTDHLIASWNRRVDG
jgi:Lar family restriction alleviation protein